MNTTLAGFGLSLFVAIVMLIAVGYQWWLRKHSAGARRLGRRLRAVAETSWQTEPSSIIKERKLSGAASCAAGRQRTPSRSACAP